MSPAPAPIDGAQPRTWATHCCGCCCDMRTAVITVNLVSIGMALLTALMFLVVVPKQLNSMSFDDDRLYDGIDDDEALEEMKTYMGELQGNMSSNYEDNKSVLIPMVLAMSTVRIVFASLGVYGAVKYAKGPVVVSLVGYVTAFIFCLFAYDLPGAVMAAFFAYPHHFFIRELDDMHSGGGDASRYEIQANPETTSKDTPAAIV